MDYFMILEEIFGDLSCPFQIFGDLSCPKSLDIWNMKNWL